MVPLQSWRAEAYKVCANRQPGREWGGGEGREKGSSIIFWAQEPIQGFTLKSYIQGGTGHLWDHSFL